MSATIDASRLTLLLNELRLPAIKHLWQQFAERSDKEGWPAARFLVALAEHEVAERDRRRIERHLGEAKLPADKILDNFDFAAVPMISKAQVSALCAGDGWLDKGANLLLFGPPGGGKSHLAAAIGLSLVEKGWRVLYTRTSDLVQRLQIARREFALEAAIQRLDRYHLLILDDLVYVTQGSSGNFCAVRTDQCSLRTPLRSHHGKPALRRMGKSLPRSCDDSGCCGSTRSSRDDLRDERGKLQKTDRTPSKETRARKDGSARDNQER